MPVIDFSGDLSGAGGILFERPAPPFGIGTVQSVSLRTKMS
jgi:hypothetical protein